MKVFLPVEILTSQGAVTSLFDVIPSPEENTREALEAVLIERLRFDREEHLYGSGVPDKNPSLDPATVKFLYEPSIRRQRLYASGFPIQVDSYEIVDAFVCLGSRFGLQQLQCYVELCYGGAVGYWVNVYYVADSMKPALIIDIRRAVMQYEADHLARQVEKAEESQRRFDENMRLLDAEEALDVAETADS